MIQIKNLKKSFNGNEVLTDINIELKRDKVYTLLAPNGTGKTTFISILCGFMEPDGGQVIYEDDMGMESFNVILSGERNLYMKNTVYENLVYFCVLKGLDENQAKVMIEKEKEKFPIYESVKNKLVESLSYGQKRIVALMSAILTGAKCIIIDEATDGLDIDNREILCKAIRGAVEDKTIIVVTHDFEFAREVSDAIAFMKDGVFSDIIENNEDCNIKEIYREIYGGRHESN